MRGGQSGGGFDKMCDGLIMHSPACTRELDVDRTLACRTRNQRNHRLSEASSSLDAFGHCGRHDQLLSELLTSVALLDEL